MDKLVRSRFAPSPTGLLHVGGVRTALFAWLLARQNDGQFILRLEDTDQSREVVGADKHIMDCLNVLGLNYDEGPDVEGKYGPYRQSQRLDIYQKWALKLIDSGRAYSDPYTADEVQDFRQQARDSKQPFLFRNHRPDQTQLNTADWDHSEPLRFKSNPKPYTWQDAVMGELSTGPEVIDDFVLIKSDGFPTYNFAHIVDDAEMKITHVIRGQEFLSSTPNFLNLYEALNIEMPILATMPHILNETGNKKLSKRDGAKDVLDYVREGYLPEAMINFIATLGWNDGSEQEIYSTKELIQKFSLHRVGRSGAHFDEKRLLWLNGAHIRSLTLDELYDKVSEYWPKEAKLAPESFKKQVLGLVQERLKFFEEIPDLTSFFFSDLPLNPSLIENNKFLSKVPRSDISKWLSMAKESFDASNFSVEDLSNRLNQLLEDTGQKPSILFSLIRIATTQAPASPGLSDTLFILGKEISLRRINLQIKALDI